MELRPGTVLQEGEYTIIQQLGAGGFGITYLAERGGKRLCIKEFFPQDYYTRGEDAKEARVMSERFSQDMKRYRIKFRKEALNIARFDVNNIVKIHDVFDENNTSYYVMDYIDGTTLYDSVCRCGTPLDEARALGYIRQAGEALKHIHQHGTVHLDIKPSNIMIRHSDDMAMVIDFGLSKHYDDKGNPTTTTPGGFSRGYTPLEMYQSTAERKYGPATDIYSLGATLYALLTATTPPEASEIALSGCPALPNSISAATRNAIAKAMQPNPSNRPQSIDEFFALLDSVDIPDMDKTHIIEDEVVTPVCEPIINDNSTPVERKICTIVEKHFDEAVRMGLIINTNKTKELITEIMIDGVLAFKIRSTSKSIGQYRVYANHEAVNKALTQLQNYRGTLLPGKWHKIGNNPEKIACIIANVCTAESSITEKRITESCYTTRRWFTNFMMAILNNILVPGVLAFGLAYILTSIWEVYGGGGWYIFFALCPVAIIGWSIYQSDGEAKYRILNILIKGITTISMFICCIGMATNSVSSLVQDLQDKYGGDRYNILYNDSTEKAEIISSIDDREDTLISIMVAYYIIFIIYLLSQAVITFKSRKTKGYKYYMAMAIIVIAAMIPSLVIFTDYYNYSFGSRDDMNYIHIYPIDEDYRLAGVLIPLVVFVVVFLLKSLIVKRRTEVK